MKLEMPCMLLRTRVLVCLAPTMRRQVDACGTESRGAPRLLRGCGGRRLHQGCPPRSRLHVLISTPPTRRAQVAPYLAHTPHHSSHSPLICLLPPARLLRPSRSRLLYRKWLLTTIPMRTASTRSSTRMRPSTRMRCNNNSMHRGHTIRAGTPILVTSMPLLLVRRKAPPGCGMVMDTERMQCQYRWARSECIDSLLWSYNGTGILMCVRSAGRQVTCGNGGTSTRARCGRKAAALAASAASFAARL